MKTLGARLDAWSLHAVAVTGVSGTRMLLGFVGLMYYVSQYRERNYLFGPDGVLPHEEFRDQLTGFSLYVLSSSDVWFQLVFHVGLVAALAVTLGVGGRPGLACHWVLLWSLYQRQPALLDGGDNLAYVVLPFLLLTHCYARFALPVGLAKRFARRLPGHVRAVSVPFHNLGVLMIAAQICLVYVVSGLYKVMGEEWQDGTALFYVMRVPEFELPGWSHLVYENDLLVVLGTYGTVAFLVYFPLGVLVPALRPWAAAMSIGFHVSIAFFMGLTGFALTMIACDLVFLSGALDRAVAWLRARRTRPPQEPAEDAASKAARRTRTEAVPEAELV
ncbi:HTTM domain-containing protein [Streptomyces sp. FIT100]|uniref:HTTM domain-containing protein n=1 Tax=Streptomyces sp. FIT100 TaxID=2837956 RepID=UPI0021C856DB|nr:HTTM domain-containing protein [Streptomyces sp. FIT100]UUN27844.1 HTTM domain-containing protein [Streptomyces sp. FIT100]